MSLSEAGDSYHLCVHIEVLTEMLSSASLKKYCRGFGISDSCKELQERPVTAPIVLLSGFDAWTCLVTFQDDLSVAF